VIEIVEEKIKESIKIVKEIFSPVFEDSKFNEFQRADKILHLHSLFDSSDISYTPL
jgi:hypothetical protein